MKVIELLTKIANGEEVPEKFRFAGQIFEKKGSYIGDEDGDSIFDSMYTDFSNINEEVEIIEEKEETKPITKESIEALGYACGEIQKCFTNGWNKSYKNEPLIEEDKKIRKIKLCYSPDIDEEIFYEDGDKPNHCILGDAGTKLLISKINEIIDYINKEKE